MDINESRIQYVFNAEKLMHVIRAGHSTDAGLREMATTCHTTASTLSRLQNGASIDMTSFLSICSALDLHPGDYFERWEWTRVK